MPTTTQRATFGSGCFWCSEAIFRRLRGVTNVVSGYTGGTIPHPTYEQVCTGSTVHAEVIRVDFDPATISYDQLLEVFFLTHDPTSLNRQGNDIGPQYRSVIFTHDLEQQTTAERMRKKLDSEKVFDHPIVTSIEPATPFFPAEAYHQQYFARNPDQPYCQAVINPKLAHLRQRFAALLKP